MQTPPPLKGEPVRRRLLPDDGSGAEAIGNFSAEGVAVVLRDSTSRMRC